MGHLCFRYSRQLEDFLHDGFGHCERIHGLLGSERYVGGRISEVKDVYVTQMDRIVCVLVK